MASDFESRGIARLQSAEDLAAVPAGAAREVMLSQLVADVYVESAPPLRSRVLECLLRSLRPLGLVAVAGGAFASLLPRESWGRLTVTIDDAIRFSAGQVSELVQFVEQAQPEALSQVAALMADNPACMNSLKGSLLLLALAVWLPRPRPTDEE